MGFRTHVPDNNLWTFLSQRYLLVKFCRTKYGYSLQTKSPLGNHSPDNQPQGSALKYQLSTIEHGLLVSKRL